MTACNGRGNESSRVVRWKHLPTYLEASQTPLPMQSNMALTTPTTNTGLPTGPSDALTLHIDMLTGVYQCCDGPWLLFRRSIKAASPFFVIFIRSRAFSKFQCEQLE